MHRRVLRPGQVVGDLLDRRCDGRGVAGRVREALEGEVLERVGVVLVEALVGVGPALVPGALSDQITARRSWPLTSAISSALDGKAVTQPPKGPYTPGWSKSAMKIGSISTTGNSVNSGYMSGVKKSTPGMIMFGLASASWLAHACASFWSTRWPQ